MLIKVAAAGVNRPDVMQRHGPLSRAEGTFGNSRARGFRHRRRARSRDASLPRRRQGHGPRQRRRLRRVLPRRRGRPACRCPTASPWSRPLPFPKASSPSGTTCSSAAGLKSRRVVPHARRHERHRRRRHPARARARCQGDRHRRLAGKVRGLPSSSGRRAPSTTRPKTSSRSSRRKPKAAASTSSSTSSAASTSSATSARSPTTAASSTSPSSRARRSPST